RTHRPLTQLRSRSRLRLHLNPRAMPEPQSASPTPPAGSRMPAEWEPHAATWLAWPHQASDWPGKLAPIPWVSPATARPLPTRVAELTGRPVWRPTCHGKRVVLEGGSIDVNGAGLLLTTEECLLSDFQCRNPGMNRADYERVFADYLGVRTVLWLNRGIAGDD